MKTLGVCYDAGVVMDIPWRPSLDAHTARREMEIIRRDLHCTAVSVVARDIGRLEMATEAALEAGLEVWFSPTVWDRGPDDTIRAARAAERLRAAVRLPALVAGRLVQVRPRRLQRRPRPAAHPWPARHDIPRHALGTEGGVQGRRGLLEGSRESRAAASLLARPGADSAGPAQDPGLDRALSRTARTFSARRSGA